MPGGKATRQGRVWMDDGMTRGEGGKAPGAGPQDAAINAPVVILALIAVFVLLQLAQDHLGRQAASRLVLSLAFMPLRYAVPLDVAAQMPGGLWTWALSPFTHMFLHAGWAHLGINSLWLLAFGAPVARRLGAVRFLLLSLACAAGGALFFLPFHLGEATLLVGASGAISGLMGAAIRLIFAGNAPLTEGLRRDLSRIRPLTVWQCFLHGRPRAFILIWMGINLVFGMLGIGAGGQAQTIAWEAHTGGFLAGLLLLGLFDRGRGRLARSAA